MSRKEFIESHGATCANWQWSWSFINKAKKFIIFGQWNEEEEELIFNENWKGKSTKQSREHIRLIEEEHYQLKTFPMLRGKTPKGTPKIMGFTKQLTNKKLRRKGNKWYATDYDHQNLHPEEIIDPTLYLEGTTKQVLVNTYERDPKARKECLRIYGYKCKVCDLDFKEKYGSIGEHFIHVHHEIPLHTIKHEYILDPAKHLKPVCPNCHAMLHKMDNPSIEELRNIVKRLNKD